MIVKPAWRDQCVSDNGGNDTVCHQYVLDNFDALSKERSIRMAVEVDFGAIGVPFLRCLGRPLKPFVYTADVLTHQAYWAGGEYHVNVRSSDCRGVPLAQSADLDYVLFQGVNVDDGATMVVMLPPTGSVVELIEWSQSLATIALVTHGLMLALFHAKNVSYLPYGMRGGKSHLRHLRYLIPSTSVISKVSDNARAIITFRGTLLVASDVWMTHWLYMWLSVLGAVVNLRKTYVMLEISTQLLSKKFTLGNVVFMCGALTKIAWLMCLMQTMARYFLKLGARFLRSLRLIRSTTREKVEWNIDGISILLGYRIYYVILFVITFSLVLVQGSPTFMVRANPYKFGAFGGVPPLPGFWVNEVACDLVTLLGLLTLAIQLTGCLLSLTKYKSVIDNGLMRLLQKRYVLSGWDGLLAAEMLGLRPYEPDFCIDGQGYTKLSIASLLQLLYLSGPSGHVHFAGDYIFHDNGFSKEPVRFSYPILKAMEMGLFTTGAGSVASSSPMTTTDGVGYTQKISVASSSPQKPKGNDSRASSQTLKQSIFEQRLKVVSDGYRGKILLIDANKINKETAQREYEVVDTLTTMSIMGIKWLMGSEKKIRVQ